jgi:L-lactate dehydrogenase complex protein LldG
MDDLARPARRAAAELPRLVAVAVSADPRSAVLARIRGALADRPALPEPVAAPRGPLVGDVGGLFAERVADYRATVVRCAGDEHAIAGAVAEAFGRHGAARVAVARGVPHGWWPAGAQVDDPPLTVEALDEVDGVLTGAALGIAETGTIVLDAAPASGRRALTLVPDLHVCVVYEADLVPGVAEALTALAPAIGAGRPITFVSGPSATSDIELDRVEGVHGPRRLEVVLAGTGQSTGPATATAR